jgi:hypothetical protein
MSDAYSSSALRADMLGRASTFPARCEYLGTLVSFEQAAPTDMGRDGEPHSAMRPS